MDLGQTLLEVGADGAATGFERFREALDPQWIEEAITATGTATVRRRKLPAEQVVWIVIGMALFRDRSIQEVVHHLDLILPDTKEGIRRGVVTSSAVVQARDRLGSEPLAESARQSFCEAKPLVGSLEENRTTVRTTVPLVELRDDRLPKKTREENRLLCGRVFQAKASVWRKCCVATAFYHCTAPGSLDTRLDC